MTDNGKAEQIARQMVDRLGADAVPLLHNLAEQAQGVGDHWGAEAWRDIAGLAEGCFVILAASWTAPHRANPFRRLSTSIRV